jgi:transcriptional regulator with XRE-family HTH domain
VVGTPTMRKKLLGNELAFLRKKAGLDQDDVAPLIGKKRAAIAQIEGGFATLSLGDLEKVLRHLDVDPDRDKDEWDLCMEWRAGARQPRNYWSGVRAAYSENFRPFTELEADCDNLEHVGSEGLPDWLQDEPYMRAMIGARASWAGTDKLDNFVEARKERQKAFLGSGAPKLHIVMSESCLLREYGPPELMRASIAHVIELSKLPNFKIQVVPFEYRPGRQQVVVGYQFTRFRIPSKGMAGPLQYVCTTLGKQYQYSDDPTEVVLHGDEFNDLCAIAEDYEVSRGVMAKARKKFGG